MAKTEAPPKNPFRLKLKFWGVRGSIPTPDPDNLFYGGNTPCVEVRLPNDEILIIDGGTGVRHLGLDLVKHAQGERIALSFLMTHFHWDHVQGIPFFAPLYSSANELTFYSGRSSFELEDILQGQMTHPYFPVPFELLPARRNFAQIESRETRFGAVSVRSFPLHHPQGAFGYRLESNGAVVVHASDREHGHAHLDGVLLEYAQDADILIYDAQYTPEEYEQRQGWGHSTWLEATRVAREARVKRLILFHHDPAHNDSFMSGIIEDASLQFENVEAASEGWTIEL